MSGTKRRPDDRFVSSSHNSNRHNRGHSREHSRDHSREHGRDRVHGHHHHSHHGPPPAKKKFLEPPSPVSKPTPLFPPPPPPPATPTPAPVIKTEPSSTSSASAPPIPVATYNDLQFLHPATLEVQDIKVLQTHHQKLREKLFFRQKQQEELQSRIDQLEMRQNQDDDVLNGINRYWNQLNEDIRILLQRCDTSAQSWGLQAETSLNAEAGTSFLNQLSTWNKEELDSHLTRRVEKSTQAVEKIIQAFDRLQQRNERISKAVEDLGAESGHDSDLPMQSLNEIVADTNEQLKQENQQLNALNNYLQKQFREISLKREEIEEKLDAYESKTDEFKEKVADKEWEVTKLILHNDKLVNLNDEVSEQFKRSQHVSASAPPDSKVLPSPKKVEPVENVKDVKHFQKENEELKEGANNRLSELEALHLSHRETLRDLERLRMEIKHIPETNVVETNAYKLLQSKFSVMYNESCQLRARYDETRQTLAQMRSQQIMQTEKTETEEILGQKKLRTEMIELEDMLSQVRQDYELLRIEFEQNITANEQTGPINREMRKLITSLQNHNQQLKGDASRSRKRYKEISAEINHLKKEKEEFDAKVAAAAERDKLGSAIKGGKDETKKAEDPAPGSSVSSSENLPPLQQQLQQPTPDQAEPSSNASVETSSREKPVEKKTDAEIFVKPGVDLKAQLKKALAEQRETKLLLDMYKSVGKDQRDKSQLVGAEKKARVEAEQLKQVVKKYQEARKEEKKKLADVDAVKKIKDLEEQLQALQKSVTTQKAEEEALITEMEVTGQAFEEMQEQNTRLVTQLSLKDDANFKLLSERIKSSQLQKAAMDELAALQEQKATMRSRVESQNVVVRKLEEKERLVENTFVAIEKEGLNRLQALEGYKRKAMETAQSSFELRLHLEKYHAQMKDAQETVSMKTAALEKESFKSKRLQDEIMGLRKRLEHLTKIEMAGSCDEVLLEEIREYKDTLTCPSCKVKRKDAVLSKCFHVFCFDCLRTRYETRQRKCPKCNAPFGANDYHRLYLT